MTVKEAIYAIRDTVDSCDNDKLEDLALCCYIGAGMISLELDVDGQATPGDESLEDFRKRARHLISMELVDSVWLEGNAYGQWLSSEDIGRNERAQFVPVHSGSWERVLATLVIENDWKRIKDTADELARRVSMTKKDYHNRNSGLWKIARLNQT
jgi:hypothetical protein